MKTNKKEMFLGYISIIYSITLLFVLVSNFTNRTSEHWRFFYAFTQQSNILALLWLTVFGITAFKPNKLGEFVRNNTVMIALTVYLSITYFIVALVLDPIYVGQFQPAKSSSELWLHHLTPIFVWVMFFLVKGAGEVNFKKSLLVLVYPLFYTVLNLVIGSTVKYEDGSKAFAYGFINPASYGGNYLIFMGVILGLLLVFSLFTVLVTKLKVFLTNNYHNE